MNLDSFLRKPVSMFYNSRDTFSVLTRDVGRRLWPLAPQRSDIVFSIMRSETKLPLSHTRSRVLKYAPEGVSDNALSAAWIIMRLLNRIII